MKKLITFIVLFTFTSVIFSVNAQAWFHQVNLSVSKTDGTVISFNWMNDNFGFVDGNPWIQDLGTISDGIINLASNGVDTNGNPCEGVYIGDGGDGSSVTLNYQIDNQIVTTTINLDNQNDPPGTNYSGGGGYYADKFILSKVITNLPAGSHTIKFYYTGTGTNGATVNNGNPTDSYVEVTFTIPEYIWTGTAAAPNQNDWNNTSNWKDGQIPNATSIVTIPGSATNFPILSGVVNVREIHFQPGAQIGNQSMLTGKAFVQYDLSDVNKWQMLSMPLEEAYPADFSFGGYPVTWVRAFTTNANGDDETKSSTIKGGWTTLQKRDAPFTYGDAFVLSLGENTESGKGLSLLTNSINELPYFQQLANGSANQALYKNIYPAQTYDGSGQSTFYYFDANNGNEINYSNNYTVARTDAAYQLLNTTPFNKGVTFSDGFALVGNPYMASLDFDALYNANINVIAPNFYIWEKGLNGYTVYSSVAGEAVGVVITAATSDNLIAPLQGFIIESTGASSASLTFKETMATVNPATKLRSSENDENKLRILAQNPVAGVRTLIAQMEGGQAEFSNLDARKIMNGISDVPEIYTLKPSDNKSIATAVNIVNAGDLLIPIGLATSYTGDITLTFSGMDSYDATLTLIDAVAGKEVNLTGLASSDYTFNYTPTVTNGEPAACEDRFFIRISNAPTGIPEILPDKVNVFESNGVIRVISGASNPIKEVAVYDLQGALVYKATAVNAISYTLDLKRSAGVYIVKVISEKNIDTAKMILR